MKALAVPDRIASADRALRTTRAEQQVHADSGRFADGRARARQVRAEASIGELWKRPGLAPRDRSIVTLAALIARNQTVEMPHYIELALDNGVKPREISEIITHLAFYSGWGNAMAAVAAAKAGLRRARDRRRPAARGIAAALCPSTTSRKRSAPTCRRPVRQGRARRRPVHDRRPVPRPVAAPGPRAARPQPGHGQRAGRVRPGRANPLPSQPGDE